METNLYAKNVDGQLITTCVPEDDPGILAMILADGFKPYDNSAPMPVVGEFQAAVPAYSEDSDRISLRWDVVDNSPAKVAAKIDHLKAELSATDYQVIKSYEFVLAGTKPPYDTTVIHTERQALRDRIRELEGVLSNP